MKSSYLVLVRHGQSEWNEKNLFTGCKDPKLTPRGIDEAIKAGKELKEAGYSFDKMFTSDLFRAQDTGRIILEQMDIPSIEVIKDVSLNERNYGDLAGLNKDEARKKWGEDQVHIWRRSFDVPPPGGESLKDTAERVLPYYKENIIIQSLYRAATDQNIPPNTIPKGISLNNDAIVTNNNPGPEFGSIPKANKAGKITSPAKIAIAVSKKTTIPTLPGMSLSFLSR